MQSIKKYFRLNTIGRCSTALLFIYCIGCSKGEQAIEQLRFTTVGLNAITIDSLRLSVIDNGTLLTDSLRTPVGSENRVVKYQDPVRRYRVTDMYSNSLLLDTLISYKALALNSITFFQPMAGAKLVLIGPPVNEPAPPKEKIKISIVYASPFTTATYDQIKVVVDNSVSGNLGTDYAAVDSFLLKRGEFSKFFIGGKNRKPQLRLFSADARNLALATLAPSTFSLADGDFSIYYINFYSIASASAIKLY